MSKRFSDTNIWTNDWFISLPLNYKMFWIYLKDSCDYAGIWKPKKIMFERLNQTEINLDEFFNLVNKDKTRIRILENGKWFIENFIVFQYKAKLKENNNVHRSVIKRLNENNIDLASIRGLIEYPSKPYATPIQPLSNPCPAPTQDIKIKTTDKEKESSLTEKNENPIKTITKSKKDSLVLKETIINLPQDTTSNITMLDVNTDKIPACMKKWDNWIYWKNIKLEDGKFTKIPYSDIGKSAKTNDCKTWKQFQDVANWKSKGFSGIGFMLNKSNPFTIIDLDKCIENGKPSLFAQNVIDYFNSYTEISPSGTGLHVILVGSIEKAVKRIEIEIYDNLRYMAMTGVVFLDRPVMKRQAKLDRTIKKYCKKKVKLKNDYTFPDNGKFTMPKETFNEGMRNNEMAKYAGILNNKNINDNEYWQYLFQINKQCCHPPLKDSEVQTVGQSVRRYNNK